MTLTDQVGNQMLRIGGNFIRSSAELLEELLEILEKNRMDDPNKYTIVEHMKKGGEVYTSRVQDDFVEDMKRHLTEQNVAFMFIADSTGDNYKTLVIRDVDKQRAEFATKLVMAEHMSIVEFEKNEFINMTHKNELACVSGLGLHEYELFRETAKNNGVKFAATVDGHNKVNILYNVNDKAELDRAMRQMTWSFTGRNGDEYLAAYKTKAESQEYIKSLYKKKAQPMYIVDAKHPERVLKIDKNELSMRLRYDESLSKETNFETADILVSIKDSKYNERLNEILGKIEEPVVISEREFRNRKDVIKDKFPKLDKEWDDKERPFREQYEEKVTIENEYKMGSTSVLDQSYSFVDDVEYEIDREDRIKLDRREQQEIDEHVRQSIRQVQQYTYFEPRSSELMKQIEAVKKYRDIEKAKSDMERETEREFRKEFNRSNKKKDKESYRDK